MTIYNTELYQSCEDAGRQDVTKSSGKVYRGVMIELIRESNVGGNAVLEVMTETYAFVVGGFKQQHGIIGKEVKGLFRNIKTHVEFSGQSKPMRSDKLSVTGQSKQILLKPTKMQCQANLDLVSKSTEMPVWEKLLRSSEKLKGASTFQVDMVNS